jgi:hypothetical protein
LAAINHGELDIIQSIVEDTEMMQKEEATEHAIAFGSV